MNYLHIIEEVEKDGINWVLSLTNSNPEEKDCFVVENSKEAFRVKNILEEWAKFIAIDFCQWAAQEGYEMLIGCFAWERPGDINSVSTKALYELYLQSKSLVV